MQTLEAARWKRWWDVRYVDKGEVLGSQGAREDPPGRIGSYFDLWGHRAV